MATTVEDYFGSRAGVLWACLNEHGALSISQIKRKTKLKDSEVYSGLGWLAREGKLQIIGDVPLLYKFRLA
ncbi:winged helix-turn-helix domain-containing protein [Candidatus Micrarchaeota archaeon]|nr:winged helix-turn-helix domain-containing protein [Candidatus Micrarchaeota archaeon]